MDGPERDDPATGWAPPNLKRPPEQPRAPACICAYCKVPGPCDEFAKVEGRWFHAGDCAEKGKVR